MAGLVLVRRLLTYEFASPCVVTSIRIDMNFVLIDWKRLP